jgi:hypothetical protein
MERHIASVLRKEAEINWHPQGKRLRFQVNQARFHRLHPYPEKIESRHREQDERLIFNIMRNITYERADQLVLQEGLTPEQHHHFDPLAR